MESPASRSEKASESVDNSSSSQDLLTSITGAQALAFFLACLLRSFSVPHSVCQTAST